MQSTGPGEPPEPPSTFSPGEPPRSPRSLEEPGLPSGAREPPVDLAVTPYPAERGSPRRATDPSPPEGSQERLCGAPVQGSLDSPAQGDALGGRTAGNGVQGSPLEGGLQDVAPEEAGPEDEEDDGHWGPQPHLLGTLSGLDSLVAATISLGDLPVSDPLDPPPPVVPPPAAAPLPSCPGTPGIALLSELADLELPTHRSLRPLQGESTGPDQQGPDSSHYPHLAAGGPHCGLGSMAAMDRSSSYCQEEHSLQGEHCPRSNSLQ